MAKSLKKSSARDFENNYFQKWSKDILAVIIAILRYTVYTALYMASQTFDDKLKNAIDKILNWQFRVLYRKKPMLVVQMVYS